MDWKRLRRSVGACVLAAALLLPTAAAASAASADVISAAIGEAGYVEGKKEYTKYGEWYGLPNAYWCDMFVSWCAMKGNMDTSRFPRQCSCTAHVKLFTGQGQYQLSAARGGNYVPCQGDVIFFYNNERHPSGAVCNHTGLVLYVENGYVYTIEGNALANRLDYSYAEVSEAIDGEKDPPDRVVINRYPLDAPHIHGYGVPKYDDRTPLELEGFVDLGFHFHKEGMFQYLDEMGVMPATSRHTFSPDHGMTRGEFIALIANFFGLPGWTEEVFPFDDIQPDASCYSAALSARAAGLLEETEENRFYPDIYISPDEAQTILSRVMAQIGLPEQIFSFTEGHYSYLLTPYTIRADIAEAFYKLCWQMPVTEPVEETLSLNKVVCPVRKMGGACYVSLEALRQAVPSLGLGEELTQHMIPRWDTDRVVPTTVWLQYEEDYINISGFSFQGDLYVDLSYATGLLPVDVEWISVETEEAILTS